MYNAVRKKPGVRVYTFSSSVSYPKETEDPDEILVPAVDPPILLDVLNKIVTINPGAKITVVYDSLSDLVLSIGLQESYKFVRQANGILNRPNVAAMFLMTLGAHEEQTVNLVKSLFPNHLLVDEQGLRTTRKAPESSPAREG